MNVGQSVFKAIADFGAIRREATRTKRSLNDMADDVGVAGSRGGKAFVTGMVKGMAKLAVMMPAILGIVAALLSGIGTLSTFGGSLLAVGGAAIPLVGILAGVGIAAGVLKAVLKDFADVMPDVVEQFGLLQDSLSQNFWGIAAGPMRDMINAVFPAMEAGLHGVATAWGEIAAEGSRTLQMMLLVNGNMTSMLDNTTAGLRAANPGIMAMIKGIVTLGTFGATYLPALGAYVTELGLRFNAWVQIAASDGSLTRWTENGITAMQDLGRVIGATVGIFSALNTAAEAGGASASLSGLAAGLERIRAVMEGPVFQSGMTTVFEGAAAGSAAFGAGIGQLFSSLSGITPLIADVLRLGGEITGMLVGGLGPALSTPGLGAGLTTFLESAKVGMANLVPLLPGLTDAFGQILTALAPIAEVALPTFVEVITLLATAIGNIIPVITPFVLWLSENPALIATVVAGFMILTAAATALGAAGNIVAMAMKFASGAMKILNLAMAAGPIGIIIMAIAALVAGLIWFFTKTETGKAIVEKVWSAIKVAMAAVVDWVTGTLVPAFQQAWEWIQQAWANVQQFFADLWQGVKDVFSTVVEALKTGWDGLIAFFETIGNGVIAAFSAVGSFFSTLWGGVMAGVTAVRDFFAAIFAFIGNLVSMFVAGFMITWNALLVFFAPLIELFRNLFNMFVAIFNFGVALVKAYIGLLILTFQWLWAQAVVIFTAVAAFLQMVWQGIVDFIMTIWNAVVAFLAAVWAGIVAGVSAAWNWVVTIITDALNAAWNWISSIWNQVVGFLAGIWATVVGAVTSAWNSVVSVITDALNTAWSWISNIWNQVVGYLSGVMASIWGTISSVWNTITGYISGIVQTIWGHISSAFERMVSAVTGPVGRAKDGVTTKFGEIVDFVSGIPGKILGALGDFGSMLWNAGSSIIGGLLDGLNAKIGDVTNFFNNLTSKIPDWKGPLPLDKVLLKGAGLAIMGGLQKAFESMYDPIKDSLSGFTSDLADQANAEIPVTFDGGGGFDPGAAMLSGWDRAYQTELAPELNSRTTMNESPGDTYHVDKLEVNNPLPEPASDSLPNTIRALSGVGVRKA